LRPGADATQLRLGSLGYAEAAVSSYRVFVRLKREGVIPAACRFQVSLPTPLAPVSAFVDLDHQAAVEPVYEAAMLHELEIVLDAVPADQLAIQWDANLEFAMLEGEIPVWFSDVRAGIVERLIRIGRQVPPRVELGFHLCYGDESRHHATIPNDAHRLVEVSNALATSLDRPLNWMHLPVPGLQADAAFFAPLAGLVRRPETQFYLGLVHPGEGIDRITERISCAAQLLSNFGVATECGWGRSGRQSVGELAELLKAVSAPLETAPDRRGTVIWPAGFVRIPDEDWTHQPLDVSGLAYDDVKEHGWYRNLDLTVEQLANILKDGDILLDYSGGTGILLDRLRLRGSDVAVGTLIVDSSAKFLRVALERWRDDPRVALRLLRFLKQEGRLQTLPEVVGPEISERRVDIIVSTNAVHLYPDLPALLSTWVRALRPGGKVLINSGNIRNPRAKRSEWILDETVWVINDLAQGIVLNDPTYAAYRHDLEDPERLKKHAEFRDRVFLEPRPLDFYTEALAGSGLADIDVREATIKADVEEWYQFLTAYHDAVLGWVGGTKRIDGKGPTEEVIGDRLALMRHAIHTLFGGRPEFSACWTYITASARTPERT
jgi:SAM-dependent methyltransferase